MSELSENKDEGLSVKQQKVMLSLLNGVTVKDAAKSNRVAEATIYLWLQNDLFKSEFRRLRREAFETSFSQIQSVSSEAVETLKRNLTCGNPGAENRAAQIILEQSAKAIDQLDILERLERIEAFQNEVNQ